MWLKRHGCFDPFRLFFTFAEKRGSDGGVRPGDTQSLVFATETEAMARSDPIAASNWNCHQPGMRTCSFVLLTAVTFLAACHRRRQLEGCPAISALDGHDPQEDAAKAFNAGDKRLLELGGLAPEAPGAKSPYRFAPGTTFRMLEGTSDMTTESCYAIRHKAEAYAKLYNQKMLALMVRRSQ